MEKPLARLVLDRPHRWDKEQNMHQNDALATAAHLHVLLRRKTGRITDTEWMASNTEYALAIVRFAREKAHSDGHEELLPLADRLERLVQPVRPSAASPTARPGQASVAPQAAEAKPDVSARYVGRLR